jgi:tetratricopeptide (TPR) repeat protein
VARLLCVAVVLLVACATARAEDPREEARLHYEVGRIAYEKEQWNEALAEFKKAYTIAPIPDLLYNIGRCQEHLGQLSAAVVTYRQFLAARPDAQERAELEMHIKDLEKDLEGSKRINLAAPAPVPVIAERTPPKSPKQPVYRRWWLWTTVGAVVVVGVVVGLGVGLSRSSGPPALGFPGVTVR